MPLGVTLCLDRTNVIPGDHQLLFACAILASMAVLFYFIDLLISVLGTCALEYMPKRNTWLIVGHVMFGQNLVTLSSSLNKVHFHLASISLTFPLKVIVYVSGHCLFFLNFFRKLFFFVFFKKAGMNTTWHHLRDTFFFIFRVPSIGYFVEATFISQGRKQQATVFYAKVCINLLFRQWTGYFKGQSIPILLTVKIPNGCRGYAPTKSKH